MIAHTDINSNHFSCKGDQKFRSYRQRMVKNYSNIISTCNCEFHIKINISSPTLRAMVKVNTEQTEHPSTLMHSKGTEHACQNPAAPRKLIGPQIVTRKATYI